MSTESLQVTDQNPMILRIFIHSYKLMALMFSKIHCEIAKAMSVSHPRLAINKNKNLKVLVPKQIQQFKTSDIA